MRRASSPEPGQEGLRPARRRLRVLVVAPGPDMIGGQSVQAARLLDCFGEDPSLQVSFQPINPRLPKALRKLQSVKYVRTVVTSLLYCAHLLARVYRHDIIHIFSASYFSFLLAPTPAILVAKLCGKKVILNYRSGEAEDHLRRWGRTAIPTIRLADVIVTPSSYLVDVFARFGLRARAIYNIVETDRFRLRKRAPLRPVFLSNRNFEPLYNVGCVLRAFELVQREYPEAKLMVAGDGSQHDELHRLASELGLRHTEFLGRVAPEKMPALYDAADVYLNSSDIDNMPGSIIESYASGLPVVTTDAGGIPYILTDRKTGILVRRGDHEALAAGAISLLRNGEFAAGIIRRAHEECRKYASEAVGAEWARLYHELAAVGAAQRGTENLEGEPKAGDSDVYRAEAGR